MKRLAYLLPGFHQTSCYLFCGMPQDTSHVLRKLEMMAYPCELLYRFLFVPCLFACMYANTYALNYTFTHGFIHKTVTIHNMQHTKS